MMADSHVRFSGYRDSPLAGTVHAPIDAIRDLLALHDVGRVRLIGVTTEFAAGLSARGEHIGGMAGPWLDGDAFGFRATRLCRDPADIAKSIRSAALEGFDWVPIGSELPLLLAQQVINEASSHGLRVMLEGRTDLGELDLDAVGSIDGLAGVLAPSLRGTPARAIASLAQLDPSEVQSRLDPIVESGVPVTPLLASTRRRCLISEVVSAPGLDDLCKILPYHRRIIELRNPAAYRFGRKHAERYLQMERLDQSAKEEFDRGWSRLVDGLKYFVARGGVLALGSGSPDTGLCPGLALAEEESLWRAHGIPTGAIDRARDASVQLSGEWKTTR